MKKIISGYTLNWKYLRKVKYFFGFSLKVLSTGFKIISPYLVDKAVCKLQSDESLEEETYLILYIVLWGSSEILNSLADLCINPSYIEASMNMSQDIVKCMNRLSLTEFEKTSLGQKINESIMPYNIISNLTSSTTDLVKSIIEAIGISIYFFVRLPKEKSWIGIIALGGWLVELLIITPVFAPKLYKYSQIQNNTKSTIITKLKEIFSNPILINSYNNLENEENDFLNHSRCNLAAQQSLEKWEKFSDISQDILNAALFSLVLLSTAGEALDPDSIINANDFVIMNIFILQLLVPLKDTIQRILKISNALANVNQLKYILEKSEYKSILGENHSYQTQNQFSPFYTEPFSIKFENVSLKFKGSSNFIIKNMSFNIDAGSTVMMIGYSGSGKSIISKLILKFYKPSSGKIYINGIDINYHSTYELRNNISYVPQDTSIFTLPKPTLEYNIKYGNKEEKDDIYDEIINVSNLNTVICERRINDSSSINGLSGGEKQRVGIARSLFKRPKLFIFDESTSAIDYPTEKSLINNINNFTNLNTSNRLKPTIIRITHSLYQISNNTNVIFINKNPMKGEKNVYYGKHKELIEYKPYYRFFFGKNKVNSRKTSRIESKIK